MAEHPNYAAMYFSTLEKRVNAEDIIMAKKVLVCATNFGVWAEELQGPVG